MTREEQANIEIGKTVITRTLSIILSIVFPALAFFVPLWQMTGELTAHAAGTETAVLPSFVAVCRLVGEAAGRLSAGRGSVWSNIAEANDFLREGIKRYEDDLERRSFMRNAVLPPAQSVFADLFRLGNEKVIMGKDGWLFYEPDVRYVTAFTNDDFLPAHAHSALANSLLVQKKTSPHQAIVDFAKQLGERGVRLVLLPVPVKPMFYPDRLSPSFDRFDGCLQHPHFARLKRDLEKERIDVFDPSDLLVAFKKTSAEPIYLKADSHWRPAAMMETAKRLAVFLEERIGLVKRSPAAPETHETLVSANGDLAEILFADKRLASRYAESVTIKRILSRGGTNWVPDPDAEILFLGDSFANIYSLGSMGWGESAGLVEQLSYFLGRPVDRICLNDNGAYATRLALLRELSRGHDRLKGKKVVVWEFAVRELTAGDWKPLTMRLDAESAVVFFAPASGREAVLSGVVDALSSVPLPGKTPYKDHIMSMRLGGVTVDGLPQETYDALVYVLSMKNNALTAAAGIRLGQTITVRVKNWYDVSETYGGLNRSELDDTDLLTADPCWCEEILK